jgi:uncharacterized membrane protein
MKAYIAVPVTLAIVFRAWSHKTLTAAGCIVAALTAFAHAIHPWNLPFILLMVFFFTGTRVTKIKHDAKAKLTIQSTGSSGGEGARTHVQVLANSGVATILILLHAYQLHQREQGRIPSRGTKPGCYAWKGDLLVVGIVANYAAVAADTFSRCLSGCNILVLDLYNASFLMRYCLNLKTIPTMAMSDSLII